MVDGDNDIQNEKASNDKDEGEVEPRELDSMLDVEENASSANEFDENL